MIRIHWLLAGAVALTAANSCAFVLAQNPTARVPARIDETQVVTLAGNVHPLARAEFDLGDTDRELQLGRLILLLKPSRKQQSDLDQLTVAQHDSNSLLFHQWLTPEEYAQRFGIGAQDLGSITQWLREHGFQVEGTSAGNRVVIFSGTAGQVAETFHTGMHRYRLKGVAHVANTQDPQIPSALAGVVSGIVSLHDFRRARAMSTHRGLGTQPQWNLYGSHYLFPADFAAIYNLNPLYDAGTGGSGVSIAIAGRSNIDLGDIAVFRTASGLKPNSPEVIVEATDPGLVVGDQDEATLDAEWSGAVAPQASIKLVAGNSTATTDGVDLAAAYIVTHALAPIVSVSYGSCEREMGTTELAFYNSLWEQAATQGMSVFVASGDSGAAGCNLGSARKGTEAGVNGLCSSPYSTCVGGTEFNEGADEGRYWGKANGSGQGSAVGYIPETVWNESGANGGYGLWATGGGVSTAYAQPTWQKVVSGASAANGMRAVPDVALTAAGHDGYIIYENGSNWIVSGTSASAPAMAGIMALVVQSQGGNGQGNANPSLYQLAARSKNPFNATLSGNNSVPGVEGFTAAAATYNLATGLGSVNAALLVSEWVPEAPLAPTLSLTTASDSVTVFRGGTGGVTLAAATGGSFSAPITLSLSGLPAGVVATWGKNPITAVSGIGKAFLTLGAAPFARIGSFSAVLSAKGAGLTAQRTLQIQVQPAPIRVRIWRFPISVSASGR